MGHDLDDDSVCRACGFDAAEWWHLERQKPKESREEQPPCEKEHEHLARLWATGQATRRQMDRCMELDRKARS